MSHLYKEPRTCSCGYTTRNRGNWSSHMKRCAEAASGRTQTEVLLQALAMKDQQIDQYKQQIDQYKKQVDEASQQLAVKDQQIAALLSAACEERKRPRHEVKSTTNNFNITNHIHVFGKECTKHITDDKLKELLASPATSIAKFVGLKHSIEENRNVRVPNSREKWVEILEYKDGEKIWTTLPKHELLANLVEDTAMELEAATDEDTNVGRRWVAWQQKLLTSKDEETRLFSDQCDMVHRTLVNLTRQ